MAKFDEHFEPKKLTKLYMRNSTHVTKNLKKLLRRMQPDYVIFAANCNFGSTMDDQLIK